MPIEEKDTLLYHALHESKLVRPSEAKKLLSRGWCKTRNNHDLFKGVRGKIYKFILWFRSFKKKESKHWNSYALALVIIGIATVATMLFTHFDNKSENNKAQIEQFKE